MDARTNGFRAACREQAGLAFGVIGRWAKRNQAKQHVGRNLGCLFLFPFITLVVWSIQAMILLMIGTPIVAYALLTMAIGGGVTRPSPTAVPHTAGRSPTPPDRSGAPDPPEFGGRVLVTPDHKWMSYDGVNYVRYAPPPAPAPP